VDAKVIINGGFFQGNAAVFKNVILERILFHTSTVLEMKKDSCGMT
jgi:hypothetical protein